MSESAVVPSRMVGQAYFSIPKGTTPDETQSAKFCFSVCAFLVGHLLVASCLCFKMTPRAKFSYENKFERVGETHFHRNGFARSLVFTLRQEETRKWSVSPAELSTMILE